MSVADDGPVLPPSPLTPDHAVPRPAAPGGPPLSWGTIPLTAIAGGMSGLLWREAYAGLTRWEGVGFIALGSMLMGLGVCLADRVWRRRSRALRWAFGTAVGTLLPLVAHVPLAGRYLPLTRSVPGVLGALSSVARWLPASGFILLAFAAIGLVFGLLAAHPGARWRIPLLGFLLPWVVATLAWNGLGLHWGYCDLLSFRGTTTGTIDTCAAASDGVFVLLFGLAVAVGHWLAARRADLPR